MIDSTFCPPDLTTFCRLGQFGLVVVGQQLTVQRTVLACDVIPDAADAFCRRCGALGRAQDTVTRRMSPNHAADPAQSR